MPGSVSDLLDTQSTFTCSKLTREALEQGVKYVQSYNKDTRTTPLAFEQVNADWVHMACLLSLL